MRYRVASRRAGPKSLLPNPSCFCLAHVTPQFVKAVRVCSPRHVSCALFLKWSGDVDSDFISARTSLRNSFLNMAPARLIQEVFAPPALRWSSTFVGGFPGPSAEHVHTHKLATHFLRLPTTGSSPAMPTLEREDARNDDVTHAMWSWVSCASAALCALCSASAAKTSLRTCSPIARANVFGMEGWFRGTVALFMLRLFLCSLVHCHFVCLSLLSAVVVSLVQ